MKIKSNLHFSRYLVRAAMAGLILCLSFGMGWLPASLAKETTDPTVQSISLVPGWNLVSFYLHPVRTAIKDVLASVTGNYVQVYAWDATGAHSSSGNWMRFVPGIPGNTLLTLDETQGFWIQMTTADSLDIVGTVPTMTNIDLLTTANGWNLVGYPSNQNRILPDALTLNGVKDFSLVYAYDANDPTVPPTPPWKRYDPNSPWNNLVEMSPSFGYWIKVGAPSTWNVPGPVPGVPPIRLTVTQSPLAIYPPIMIYTAQLTVLIPTPSAGFTVDFYNLSGIGLEYLGSVVTQTGQAVLSRQMNPGTYTAIARMVINSQVYWSNEVTYKVF
jgi:hypothetical protein